MLYHLTFLIHWSHLNKTKPWMVYEILNHNYVSALSVDQHKKKTILSFFHNLNHLFTRKFGSFNLHWKAVLLLHWTISVTNRWIFCFHLKISTLLVRFQHDVKQKNLSHIHQTDVTTRTHSPHLLMLQSYKNTLMSKQACGSAYSRVQNNWFATATATTTWSLSAPSWKGNKTSCSSLVM